ncbi:MAG: type I-D CRISPR-associated helicase Cas3' [Halothece sp.]
MSSQPYQVTLNPIYSSPVTETPNTVKLPQNWNLVWHQLETLIALRNPKIDVVINTAMTGDGKSLAAFLSTLQDEKNVIALYPTNELARDQETQIQNYINLFQPKLEPRVNRLSSAELELYAEQENLKKGSAIASRSKNSEILITNPDLFHYLHRQAYLTPYDNPDKIWNRIDKNFDLFIFDEFHIFSAPQVASVINTMLLIRNTNRNKKFLFLSATPDEQLIEKLEKAQFTYQHIDPIQAKKYQFPTTKREGEELQNQNWRQVSREISLQFIPLESGFSVSETWLKENKELILSHFIIPPNPPLKGERIPPNPPLKGGNQTVNSPWEGERISPNSPLKGGNQTVNSPWEGERIPPNSPLKGGKKSFSKTKGAVILNSIAAVKRLVPIFQELFDPYGLTVGENTGLSSQQTKLASLDTDLVFGTSTIDIGVDFKINFLIYESSDVGNFIQRLGRLGRHDSFKRNGETIPFHQFTAYALVPKFLVERLFETTSPPLQVNQRYDRPQFNAAIQENYRQINDFQGYYKRWGAVQSVRLYYDLKHPNIVKNYPESCQKLQQDCERVFDISLKKVNGRIYAWKKQWEEQSGKKNNPIAEEAMKFRGSSPLQCGLYDLTETRETERFKTYDLPGILSNLEVEMWTEAGFMRTLQETRQRLQQPIPKGRFKHCIAFLKLRGYREERLNWRFTYGGNLQTKADAWRVQVLTGVGVWQPDNSWILQLDRRLRQQPLVCYILPRPVTEVRQRLQLPMHFQLYPISDETSLHDSTSPYSIAIGQSALLVDTLAYRLQTQGGETWIA